jgi:hypothetical protein
MKHFLISLVAFGLTTGTFAALPAASNPTEVSIPLFDGGFLIGATSSYLHISGSNGANDFLASLNVGYTSILKNVDLGYDWGWGVNVGYTFAQTGNDINLNYFHFDSDAISSAIAPPGGIIDTNIVNIKEKADYDLDQVDLTGGQSINVGCRLRLHFSSGLRWSDVKHEFNDDFLQRNQNPALPNGHVVATEKNDFDGVGPLVGIDANYYLGMGFGIVGHIDSALLIGNIDTKSNATTVNFVNPNTTITITGDFKAKSTRRVVPVTDAKLGADYIYLFNNSQNSNLTLEVGYQVSNYFNSVDMLSISPNGVIQERHTSDMGLNGIYATATLYI